MSLLIIFHRSIQKDSSLLFVVILIACFCHVSYPNWRLEKSTHHLLSNFFFFLVSLINMSTTAIKVCLVSMKHSEARANPFYIKSGFWMSCHLPWNDPLYLSTFLWIELGLQLNQMFIYLSWFIELHFQTSLADF